MNSHIKGLIIFSDKEKRLLELSKGLNIIAGHSKTGKSAILDIIDWCLGSTICTIPNGEITNFAVLYALLIEFNGKTLLIGRKNAIGGKNYMYVTEVKPDLDVKEINLGFFTKDILLKRANATEYIEKYMNFEDSQAELFDDDLVSAPKAGLRSAVAYMFQHQDIISSNRNLFYVDPIKSHFPVLAGWYGQKFYLLNEAIKKHKKKIEALTKSKDEAEHFNRELINNVRDSFRRYYGLINIDYNENWTIDNLISRNKNLEGFELFKSDNNVQNRQDEILKEQGILNSKYTILNSNISKINNNKRHANEYYNYVNKYKQRTNYLKLNKEFSCPVCENSIPELTVEAGELLKADELLQQELTTIPIVSNEFDEQLSSLTKELQGIKDQIKILKTEFDQNAKVLEKIKGLSTINEQRQNAMWKVRADCEIYTSRLKYFDYAEYDITKNQLAKFEDDFKSFKLNEKYESERKIIEDTMNLIVERLDFEHKPPQLNFELKPSNEYSFSLFNINLDDERIPLRQIGSASNALACHIGLFLSLLNYFCNQEKSKVPSILFLDQPSQVYFPSGKDNNDIEKVGQIYETILDYITKIEEESGIAPQIIIADHIKDLGENNIELYGHYFKADWRDGSGLI